jgi:hypothetical protein
LNNDDQKSSIVFDNNIEKRKDLDCGSGAECLNKGVQCYSAVCDNCMTAFQNCVPDFNNQSDTRTFFEKWNVTIDCYIAAGNCLAQDSFCNPQAFFKNSMHQHKCCFTKR